MKRSIYLASPFFNEKEIALISKVEQLMRDRGIEIYSPREHEDREEKELLPDWCKQTFLKDVAAINRCDCVLAIYAGNYSDSGTAWECGYAFALGKPVVVLQAGEDSNLMIHESARANITLEELAEYDFENLPKVGYSGKAF